MNKLLTLLLILILSIVLVGCNNPNQGSTKTHSYDTVTIIKKEIDTIFTPAYPPATDSTQAAPENIEIPDEVHNYAKNHKKEGIIETSGLVRYNIPDSMQIGKDYDVNIRISKQRDTTKITINMPQGKTECIRVGSTMEVKLLDPEGGNFEIAALNSVAQTIEDDGDFTSWEWTVKPLIGGAHKLKMFITIKAKDLVKDIPVFDKEIYVQSSPTYSLKKLITENWTVLLPSVFIPILGGLWHIFFRKRKKVSDEDEDNY